MAARPSPAAVRARKDAEREAAAHSKTKDKLSEMTAARDELQKKLDESNKDTNALAASNAQIEVLKRAEDGLIHALSNKEAEVMRLRGLLDNVVHGGVHVGCAVRV